VWWTAHLRQQGLPVIGSRVRGFSPHLKSPERGAKALRYTCTVGPAGGRAARSADRLQLNLSAALDAARRLAGPGRRVNDRAYNSPAARWARRAARRPRSARSLAMPRRANSRRLEVGARLRHQIEVEMQVVHRQQRARKHFVRHTRFRSTRENVRQVVVVDPSTTGRGSGAESLVALGSASSA